MDLLISQVKHTLWIYYSRFSLFFLFIRFSCLHVGGAFKKAT